MQLQKGIHVFKNKIHGTVCIASKAIACMPGLHGDTGSRPGCSISGPHSANGLGNAAEDGLMVWALATQVGELE